MIAFSFDNEVDIEEEIFREIVQREIDEYSKSLLELEIHLTKRNH